MLEIVHTHVYRKDDGSIFPHATKYRMDTEAWHRMINPHMNYMIILYTAKLYATSYPVTD